MALRIDLKGHKYGRLTVVKQSKERTAHENKIMWECICDCETEKIVSSAHLRSGSVKSCGCNMAKGRKSYSEFIEWVRRIAGYNFILASSSPTIKTDVP